MTPEFTILIDGRCHLCVREARFLSRLDAGRERLGIIDIAAPGFDPAAFNTSQDELMGRIHGVTAEGRLVTGMEVFRRAYAATGWAWIMGWTAWPLVRPVVDRLYVWFARNRLRLSAATSWLPGGRDLPACRDGVCRLPR